MTPTPGNRGPATTLARRYRLLLRAYPAGYRARRGDELVGTLLDAAPPGRTWPSVADVVDLAHWGARERLRRPLAAGAHEGLRLAAPYALGLAGTLALFALLVIEPGHRTAAPVAYAGWLAALLTHALGARRALRRVTAGAMALTVAPVVLAVLPGIQRPPLWVLSALLLLGAAHLAGTADATAPPEPTERLLVSAGALVAAALTRVALTAWRPPGNEISYFQPGLYLIGLVFGAVVLGLGAAALAAARRREPARPWLWAALLIALPGSWLGPAPLGTRWSTAPFLGQLSQATAPGFGRLAQVLAGSVAVLAAMAALTPTPAAPGAPARRLRLAGGVAVGVAAGLAGAARRAAGNGQCDGPAAGRVLAGRRAAAHPA